MGPTEVALWMSWLAQDDNSLAAWRIQHFSGLLRRMQDPRRALVCVHRPNQQVELRAPVGATDAVTLRPVRRSGPTHRRFATGVHVLFQF